MATLEKNDEYGSYKIGYKNDSEATDNNPRYGDKVEGWEGGVVKDNNVIRENSRWTYVVYSSSIIRSNTEVLSSCPVYKSGCEVCG